MIFSYSITQTGQSHIVKKTPGQDYSATKRYEIGSGIVISAISDGVGTCAYSQFGSETAVKSVMAFFEDKLSSKEIVNDDNQLILEDTMVLKWIDEAFEESLEAVEDKADEMKLPFLQFDCTLTVTLFYNKSLFFGHVGDGGVVALFTDGSYRMITHRHKGEEANSVFPLRSKEKWEFKKADNEVASFVMMTDGVLDLCVKGEKYYNNIVYWPFLELALTCKVETDEEIESVRKDWYDLFAENEDSEETSKDYFRKRVTDDITFVVVLDSEAVKNVSVPDFDYDEWNNRIKQVEEEKNKVLYKDFYEFQKKKKTNRINYENKENNTGLFGKKKSSKVIREGSFNRLPEKQYPIRSDSNREDLTKQKEQFSKNENSLSEAGKEFIKAGKALGKEIGRAVEQALTGESTSSEPQNDRTKLYPSEMLYENERFRLYALNNRSDIWKCYKGDLSEALTDASSKYFQVLGKIKWFQGKEQQFGDSIIIPGDLTIMSGKIGGYLMPEFDTRYSLADIMDEKKRGEIISGNHQKKLLTIAYNLACLVDDLHEKNIVIGDLNPENIRYLNGTLKLIGPESLTFVDSQKGRQFTTNSIYPGIAAPELHGIDLYQRRKKISKESDDFSLAVLIFWLITGGRHPFGYDNMIINGKESVLDIVNIPEIKNGKLAYSFNKEQWIKQGNKFVENENTVELLKCFENTFDYNLIFRARRKRTSALKWKVVLWNLLQ